MAKFSTNDLFDNNRYKLLKGLGGGQDAEVWTALDTLADEVIVLKIFVRVGEKVLGNFFDDFKLLKNLKHDHITKPFDIGKWDSQPYQKLEFIKNGSIFKRIEDEKLFSEQETAVFLAQMGSALAYLHQNNIVHCDVKPENVLLKDDGSYTLIDFGISQKMKNSLARATMGRDADITMFGFSRAYAPPEISNKSNIKPSRDIFSLGASLYELLTGDLPFDRDGGRALLMGVAAPNLPDGFSPELNTIIQRCLEKEPELRPTAHQLATWADDFLENGTWDLTDQPNEQPTIPSRKTIISKGTASTNSNKFEEQKPKPEPPINKYNKLIWIVAGVLLVIGLLYFLTKKESMPQPQPMPKSPNDKMKVVKDTVTKIEQTPKPGLALKPKKQMEEIKKPLAAQKTPSIDQQKWESTKTLTDQYQRIEDLLSDGELAINEANNKPLAIEYFTQARVIKQLYKLGDRRFEQLYKNYVKKGDAVFEAEFYSQAKAWYQVAQALHNTAEIREKIEICTNKIAQ